MIKVGFPKGISLSVLSLEHKTMREIKYRKDQDYIV